MKDTLKMMRFDFISAVGTSSTGGNKAAGIMGIIMPVMLIAAALFISPVFAFCIIGATGAMIVPLQSAKNAELGRLYGVLPIARKNITRARFLYIFLAHLFSSCISVLLAFVSVSLNLNRFLQTDSDALKVFANMFDTEVFIGIIPIFTGFSVFSCVTFSFMEMIGQINGRQSEMKVLFIIILAICVIILGGTFILGQLGYPEIKLPELPWWLSVLTVLLSVFGLCVLFGEITASKLSKREL